jgi:membrane protease YdiL (CAAX protease family)
MPRLFAKDLSWLLVPTILGILMAPILRDNWPALRNLFRFKNLTARLIFASIALGVVLRLAQWGGKIAMSNFRFVPSSDPDAIIGPLFVFNCPPASTLALTILISVFLTPILEEIVHRGFLLHPLLRRGRAVAIIGSAILFGIFHVPQTIPSATVIGLFLAAQFLNSTTLWACTITHATYNALVIFDWHCIIAVWGPDRITNTNVAVGILSLSLLVVSLALAALLTSRNWYTTKAGRNAPHS